MIKVADFGLSESLDPTKSYFRQALDSHIKLPFKWMAPESIRDGVFSKNSDVVSWQRNAWPRYQCVHYIILCFGDLVLIPSILTVGIWRDTLGDI